MRKMFSIFLLLFSVLLLNNVAAYASDVDNSVDSGMEDYFPGNSPWLENVDDSIYDNSVDASDKPSNTTPKPPGMVEKSISELVRNIASSLLNVMESSLNASLDSIVYGRVGSGHPNQVNIYAFELRNGNPYGVPGSVCYSLIRGMCYIFMGIYFVYLLAKGAWDGRTAKSRNEIKEYLFGMVTKFVCLAIMPFLLDLVLYIRDVILYGIKNVTGQMLVGGATLSTSEIFLRRAEASGTFVDAVMYLGTVILTGYFIFIYVSIAIDMMISFVVYPGILMFPKKDTQDQLLKGMLGDILTPVIDAILLLIPLLTSLMLSNVIKGVAIIQLVMCMLIIPSRSRIKGLLGMQNYAERNGIMGLFGAMALGRMIGSKVKHGIEQVGNVVKDAKKASLYGEMADVDREEQDSLLSEYQAKNEPEFTKNESEGEDNTGLAFNPEEESEGEGNVTAPNLGEEVGEESPAAAHLGEEPVEENAAANPGEESVEENAVVANLGEEAGEESPAAAHLGKEPGEEIPIAEHLGEEPGEEIPIAEHLGEKAGEENAGTPHAREEVEKESPVVVPNPGAESGEESPAVTPQEEAGEESPVIAPNPEEEVREESPVPNPREKSRVKENSEHARTIKLDNTERKQPLHKVSKNQLRNTGDVIQTLEGNLENLKNKDDAYRQKKAELQLQNKQINREMLDYKPGTPEHQELKKKQADLGVKMAELDQQIERNRQQSNAQKNRLEDIKQMPTAQNSNYFDRRRAEILQKHADVSNFELPEFRNSLSNDDLQRLYRQRAVQGGIKAAAKTGGALAGAVTLGSAGIFLPQLGAQMAVMGAEAGSLVSGTAVDIITAKPKQEINSSMNTQPTMSQTSTQGAPKPGEPPKPDTSKSDSQPQGVSKSDGEPPKPVTPKSDNQPSQPSTPKPDNEPPKPSTPKFEEVSPSDMDKELNNKVHIAIKNAFSQQHNTVSVSNSLSLKAIQEANIQAEKYFAKCKESQKSLTLEEMQKKRIELQTEALTEQLIKKINFDTEDDKVKERGKSLLKEKIQKILERKNKAI